MKKISKALWRTGCIVLALVFLVSCCTTFISSARFSYTIFFALLFPYLFIAIAVAGVVNLFVNKKWAMVFFVLFIAGIYNFFLTVAVSPLHSWNMQKDSGSLRIMTWNVSEFVNPAPLNLPDAETRRNIYHTISEYQPDVLCLQEYYNAANSRDLPSEQHELDSLGYHYLAYSGDMQTQTFYGLIQRGCAIYSKFPLISNDTLNIRKDYNIENVVHTDIIYHNKPVRVATGHLKSYYLFPDSARGYAGRKTVAKKLYTYKQEVEMKIRDVESLHERQAGRIRSLLDSSDLPSVYCGDMNATPVMYSYQLLKGNHLDAFLKAGNGIGATFYNLVPTLRIDVIFPSNDFIVNQCTIVQRKLGDHYPVVADLKWK